MKLNTLVRYTIILNCFFLNEADEDGIAQTVKPNKQSTPQNSNRKLSFSLPLEKGTFPQETGLTLHSQKSTACKRSSSLITSLCAGPQF